MTRKDDPYYDRKVYHIAAKMNDADDPSMLVTLFGAVRELRRIAAPVGEPCTN